jgi:hypothetical protein
MESQVNSLQIAHTKVGGMDGLTTFLVRRTLTVELHMREVYLGKPITLQNQKFLADEFYTVEPALALAIVSSGCGVYADEDDETNSNQGEE